MRSPDTVEAHDVVVTDDIVDLAAVQRELPAQWPGRVRFQPGLPAEPGVVALLAGPGTEVSAAALDRLPDLRAVVVTSMGWDHVDVDAARSRGVTVVGVGPYCVDEVAEHTLALVLDLLRGVTRLDRAVRGGTWDYASVGRPVRGASLGLVGLGRIGAAVAWRAGALGMRVSAFDPFVDAFVDPLALAGAPEVAMAASLDTLVAGSDVVSVHVPLTPQTEGLIGKDVLARFPEGSYLVNVSRGEVVTEEALAEALQNGRLAGAALDVLAHEPPGAGDPMLSAPRTVLTPHAAWYSPAAVERLSQSAGAVLAGALAEKGPRR